jgi:hypothetical protein
MGRKVIVGIVKRNVERAQKVVTDAFIAMFDGKDAVTALRDSLLNMLFEVVVRPVVRQIVSDMAPMFSGNAPPLTAQRKD